jgi:hypothetical protein
MDAIGLKAWSGAAAAALTLLAYLPYLWAILLGDIRPHVFTWIIWGTATMLGFAAALDSGGGWGAWVIGLSAVTSFVVATLAYVKRADVTISHTDVLFFAVALAAVPLWVLAHDPLWAVLLLTLIELLGFGPTFRKTWHAPRSESMTFLVLLILRNTLILSALERYTLTTVLFPAAAGAACLALVAIMIWATSRRTCVSRKTGTCFHPTHSLR